MLLKHISQTGHCLGILFLRSRVFCVNVMCKVSNSTAAEGPNFRGT